MRSTLLPILVAGLVLVFTFLPGCTGFIQGQGPATTPPVTVQPATTRGPVVAAGPYPPAEPYEMDPRFVRNTPEYRVDPALFTEVYRNRFSLNYNSVGLIASAEKAPLVIDFSVTPGHSNPNYCFFIFTVRDADQGVVVGQEGYARTFSTDNPKRLVFTSPGRYHLNLYGNWVDVDLQVRMKK